MMPDLTSERERAKLRKLLERGDPKSSSGLRNEVALALLDKVEEGRVLTCVYCGHEYPEGTPSWGSDLLTEHIRTCEKHPMRDLESKLAQLRRALVGLVGLDTREELEAMEAVVRLSTIPEKDRASTIDAIHALMDTLPASAAPAGGEGQSL